jgi:metal-dependent amidase/aminoacylase/carboxypeptidase family protein
VTQLIEAADERNELKAKLSEERQSKGRISGEREASMVENISAKNKKIRKLENRLGEGEHWMKADTITWAKEMFPEANTNAVFWALGTRLTHWCESGERPIKKVPGQHFNTVNAYPAVAIESYQKFLQSNSEEQEKIAELIKKRASIPTVLPLTRQ